MIISDNLASHKQTHYYHSCLLGEAFWSKFHTAVDLTPPLLSLLEGELPLLPHLKHQSVPQRGGRGLGWQRRALEAKSCFNS